MDLIDALYYKANLNKLIRQHQHKWDRVIELVDMNEFEEFRKNRIGEIWLRKRYGLEYSQWLNS